MTGLNAAVISMGGADVQPLDALGPDHHAPLVLAITNSPEFTRRVHAHQTASFADVGLDTAPFDSKIIAQSLRKLANTGAVLVVDMSWGIETAAASANFDIWGALCDDLVQEGLRIISIYNWHLLIGDQMLATLRAHPHFFAVSGLQDNPFWLPNTYLTGASLREQVSFLLGRLVPAWADMVLPAGSDGSAAMGTDPGWLPLPDLGPMRGLGQRWKIRCFGRLRVYTSGSAQIDWQISGGSPRKIKALFAYLLTRGEAGAPADQLAELLWPEGDDEAAKRARLHQTVAMLRKVLGGKEFVERRGTWYHLRPPPGSWIDLHSFEQVCRRAKVLERSGEYDAAYAMLQAAERLYTGDLFEDLLPEYIESEVDDWCRPQRNWLRDMALKVHRDMAVMLRKRGNLRDALTQCQRALDIDPACEIAHAETMQIFHAQGRREAIARQYRQYTDALAALGGDTKRPPLAGMYHSLMSDH